MIPFDDINKSFLFVLVKRGGCKFSTKVKNIENAGGNVAIIYDNDNDINLDKIPDILLVELGYDPDINIPSMLISSYVGNKLQDFLEQQQIQNQQENKS